MKHSLIFAIILLVGSAGFLLKSILQSKNSHNDGDLTRSIIMITGALIIEALSI